MSEFSHVSYIQAMLERQHKIDALTRRGVQVTEADFPDIVPGKPQRAHPPLPDNLVELPPESRFSHEVIDDADLQPDEV